MNNIQNNNNDIQHIKNEFKSMKNYDIFKKIENKNPNLAKFIVEHYKYNYDYQTKVNRYCEQLDVFLPFIYAKDKQKKIYAFLDCILTFNDTE